MSRQKANKTRVTNKGNVMWTVEWVDQDGKKAVDDENSQGRQIRELWGEMTAKRLNIEKGKKRKRESEKQIDAQNSKAQETEQKVHVDTPEQATLPVTAEFAVEDQLSAPRENAGDYASNQQLEPSASSEPADDGLNDTSGAQTEAPGGSEDDNETTNALAPPPEHFYLLRPFTASKSIVLTPVDPSKSLTETLKGQTVLEFPTIYILPDEPQALPAGYLLAEQYEKVQKAEEVEVDNLMQRTYQSTGGALEATREEEKPLDANSILDMLKRDVGV